MTREEHLKAIHLAGFVQRGKTMVVLMLCSGPECGGAEMFARPTAAHVAVEAAAHIDKIESLS